MTANIDAFDTSEYPTTHPLHSITPKYWGRLRMSVTLFSRSNLTDSEQDVFSEASKRSYQDYSKGNVKIACTQEFEA